MPNRRLILPIVASLCLVATPCDAVSPTDRTNNTAKGTGFVRVEQMDGIWWFVDANGDRFVSVGVNHIEPHLWLAPYNREQTIARYGSDMVDASGHFNSQGRAAAKWIDRQVEICRDLGFNTLGKHTHPLIEPKLYRDKMYYIASLETAPLAGWRERKGEGPRPDVFSEDFRQFLEQRIKQVCEQHKDQRNLIGYLYTDVPSWVLGRGEQMQRNDTTMIYPWLNAIVALGETSPGKRRWLQHLEERHGTPEAAAQAWGFTISPTYGITWDDLARQIDWSNPVDVKAAKADMLSFMPIIVEQWYALHREIILKHDPNHLILGDKNLINWHHDWMLPSIGKHVDVICLQAYGRWADDSKLTDQIYQATGKPIFNGDGCFGLASPEQQQWGVKGFRTGAKSLEEVADWYQETLAGMMSKPYMLGWHHCGYIQQWDQAERGDSPRNENGFLDPFENYRVAWTEAIKKANAEAQDLHLRSR